MKSDFKIDFSKRDVISTVCFTVVMIIVLVLGNTFGFVEAGVNYTDQPELSSFCLGTGWGDLYSSPLNIQDYTSSSIYDSDAYIDWINFNGSLSTPNTFSLRDSINLPVQSSTYWYDQLFDVDFSYYSCYAVTDNFIYLFPNGSVICGDWVYCPTENFNNTTTYYIGFRYSLDGGFHYLGTEAWLFDEPNNHVFGNYHYHDMGTNFDIVFSNMSMYVVKNQYVSDTAEDFVNYLGGGNDHFTPINYMLYDGNYTGGSFGGSSENDSNNMYLEDCKFTFSFNKYVDSISNDPLTYHNNWGGGYITFSGMLNDYQYDNISNFSLEFKFQVLVKGKGTLHQEDNDPIPTEREEDFYGNFYYTTTKSLSDLSNGSIGWRFSDITSSFEDSSAVINGSSITHLDRFIANMTEYVSIDWSYWKIYCTAYLVSSDEGTSSTSRIDSYNFVTGSSSNVSDGLNTNLNPYFDSDSGVVSGDGEHIEDTSSQTTSTGYGTVTQTNTQTVNVNTNYDTSGTIDRLEQILAGEDGSSDDTGDVSEDSSNEGKLKSYVSKFRDLLQANNWLVMCNLAFGFIPVEVWTTLATFFLVCISFLVAFCLLRLIFDFL